METNNNEEIKEIENRQIEEKEEFVNKIEEVNGLSFIVSLLNPTTSKSVTKHLDLLKNYYNDRLYTSILNLCTLDEITELSLKIVLEDNNLAKSLIEDSLKIFRSLSTIDVSTLETINEKLSRVVCHAKLKSVFDSTKSPDKIVQAIKNSDVSIEDTTEYDKYIRQKKMSEVDIAEAIKDLGTPIFSSVDLINKSFVIKGYIKNQLIDVVAPPSCLVGSTRVWTMDYGLVTLEELYNKSYTDFKVFCFNIKKQEPSVSVAKYVKLMKRVYQLVQITLETGQVIQCTDDHKFLLDSGSFVEAYTLRPGVSLLGAYDSLTAVGAKKITEIKRIEFEEPVPVYDVISVTDYGNFFICDDKGQTAVIAHNCGKSLFLQNEAVSFLSQGYKVVYVALGDLNEIDFITRMCAIIYKIRINDATIKVQEYFDRLYADHKGKMDNLELLLCDPDTLTIEELQDYLYRKDLVKPGNILMIDYDTNFKSSNEMYSKGEEIFNIASALSKKGRFDLVFIASQPKINYYDQELIPQEAASESSRKSQIVDVMITIGRNPESQNQSGCLNLAKVRRGGRKTFFYYMLDQSGRFIPINKKAYIELKSREDLILMGQQELADDLIEDIKVALDSDNPES